MHGDVLRDVARGQAAHLGERGVFGGGADGEVGYERDPHLRALLPDHLRHNRGHLGLEHERLRFRRARGDLPQLLVAHLRQRGFLVVGKLAPPLPDHVLQHAVPEVARLKRLLRGDERRRTVASEENTGARADELPGAARENRKPAKGHDDARATRDQRV